MTSVTFTHFLFLFFIFKVWEISRARLFPRTLQLSIRSASFGEARVTTWPTGRARGLTGGPDPRQVRKPSAQAKRGWHLSHARCHRDMATPWRESRETAKQRGRVIEHYTLFSFIYLVSFILLLFNLALWF